MKSPLKILLLTFSLGLLPPVFGQDAKPSSDSISLKDSTWTVINVREIGTILPATLLSGERSTEGKFIYVRYKVTNNTNEEEQIVFSPKVKDARGRKFQEMDESGLHLPDGEKPISMEQLPAGVPKLFSAIFEVPADAESLSFLARSFDAIGTQEKQIPVAFTKPEPVPTKGSVGADIVEAIETELGSLGRQQNTIANSPNGNRKNLVELKGQLAKVNSKIETDRTRWQNSVNIINQLTNNKRTAVQEGSYAYRQCLAASQVIQEIEAGAPDLVAEKASLEAMIKELEKE